MSASVFAHAIVHVRVCAVIIGSTRAILTACLCTCVALHVAQPVIHVAMMRRPDFLSTGVSIGQGTVIMLPALADQTTTTASIHSGNYHAIL
jgi:fumarate hydratase class II